MLQQRQQEPREGGFSSRDLLGGQTPGREEVLSSSSFPLACKSLTWLDPTWVVSTNRWNQRLKYFAFFFLLCCSNSSGLTSKSFYKDVRPELKILCIFFYLLCCPNSPGPMSMGVYKEVRPGVKIFWVFFACCAVQTLQASRPWASIRMWGLGLKYVVILFLAVLSRLSRPHVDGIVIQPKPRAHGSHLF